MLQNILSRVNQFRQNSNSDGLSLNSSQLLNNLITASQQDNSEKPIGAIPHPYRSNNPMGPP